MFLGEDYNLFPPKEYCSIFLGRSPPCEGGVMALNGINGEVLWTYWTNDTIFSLQCSEDINGDQISDCLATGKSGVPTYIGVQIRTFRFGLTLIYKVGIVKRFVQINSFLFNFIKQLKF